MFAAERADLTGACKLLGTAQILCNVRSVNAWNLSSRNIHRNAASRCGTGLAELEQRIIAVLVVPTASLPLMSLKVAEPFYRRQTDRFAGAARALTNGAALDEQILPGMAQTSHAGVVERRAPPVSLGYCAWTQPSCVVCASFPPFYALKYYAPMRAAQRTTDAMRICDLLIARLRGFADVPSQLPRVGGISHFSSLSLAVYTRRDINRHQVGWSNGCGTGTYQVAWTKNADTTGWYRSAVRICRYNIESALGSLPCLRHFFSVPVSEHAQ